MWSIKMQTRASPRKKSRRRSRGEAGDSGADAALMGCCHTLAKTAQPGRCDDPAASSPATIFVPPIPISNEPMLPSDPALSCCLEEHDVGAAKLVVVVDVHHAATDVRGDATKAARVFVLVVAEMQQQRAVIDFLADRLAPVQMVAAAEYRDTTRFEIEPRDVGQRYPVAVLDRKAPGIGVEKARPVKE